MNRQNGYYWLKVGACGPFESGWIIGEWVGNSNGGFWELTGLETPFDDANFEEISISPIVHYSVKK